MDISYLLLEQINQSKYNSNIEIRKHPRKEE